MLRIDTVPAGAINYDLNPRLQGLSPLEVHDAVVNVDEGVGVFELWLANIRVTPPHPPRPGR